MSGFTELLEDNFGKPLVNDVLAKTQPSGGLYRADGYYSMDEFQGLLTVTSRRTGVSESRLLVHFGHYLFTKLAVLHAELIATYPRVIPLLAQLDSEVHRQARSHYLQADIPDIQIIEHRDDRIVLYYRANHRLVVLACGMIEGAARYLGSQIELSVSEPTQEGGYLLTVIEADRH